MKRTMTEASLDYIIVSSQPGLHSKTLLQKLRTWAGCRAGAHTFNLRTWEAEIGDLGV